MRISKLFPKKYMNRLRTNLKYCGIDNIEAISEKILNFGILLLFVIFLISILFLKNIILPLILTISSFLVYLVLVDVVLFLISDSRSRQVEQMLPDCLQLIASNMKAGLTIDKSLWLSARPELGILEEEIRKVGANVIGGKSLKTALREMTFRIKSTALERSVNLIIEGIESGGELASLLEQTADNLRSQQMLQKEIRASVLMYTIFIFIASVLGAPFLFSVSLHYVDVMHRLWTPVPENIYGIKTLTLQLSSSNMLLFSIVSISIISIFSSLLIGLIQHGDEKRGLKYMPILLGLSLAVFFISKIVVSNFFGIMV